MKYVKLGSSDLNVSRIILGCMGFGDPALGHHKWTVDAAQTEKIVGHALECGINCFDTAMKYQSGTSEEYLGKALKACAKREDYIVATKMTPYCEGITDGSAAPKQYVQNCVDNSLKRLGLDYIDLYILHAWDSPMEGVMEGLNQAVQSGKVRYLGISNCLAWQIAKANFYAKENGMAEFVSFQGIYNLLQREDEREMFPYCMDQNIAVTPYSSIASGRLARKPDAQKESMRQITDTAAINRYDTTANTEGDLKIISRVAEIAEKRQVSMAEIAIAWDLYRADATIVGATKPEQIDNLAKAADLVLSKEEIDYLEELYFAHPMENNYKGALREYLSRLEKR